VNKFKIGDKFKYVSETTDEIKFGDVYEVDDMFSGFDIYRIIKYPRLPDSIISHIDIHKLEQNFELINKFKIGDIVTYAKTGNQYEILKDNYHNDSILQYRLKIISADYTTPSGECTSDLGDDFEIIGNEILSYNYAMEIIS